MRRSPRLRMPSAVVAAGSCHLRLTLRARCVALRSRSTLRCSSAPVSCPNHWNGVCGLGTKPPTLAVTRRPPTVAAPDLHAVAGQLGDPPRVLVGLRRQPDEEVELDPRPALGEGGVDGAVEVVLGDQLVDHLAQPPRAGFGGEREPAAASTVDLAGEADREGVDAQRRQVDGQRAAGLHRRGSSRMPPTTDVDAADVGRRQRRQRDLVVAGAAQTRRRPSCAPGRRAARAPDG